MALCLRTGDGVERLVRVLGHRALLLVQCRLPYGQTEGVLDVDERLAVLEGYRVLLTVLVVVVVTVRASVARLRGVVARRVTMLIP